MGDLPMKAEAPPRPLPSVDLDDLKPCISGVWTCLFMPWKWRQRALAKLRRECLAQARTMGLRDPDAVIAAAREFEAYLSGTPPPPASSPRRPACARDANDRPPPAPPAPPSHVPYV
ncbi:hypothetical protein K6L44_12340 [Gluconacetobacter entanii]|uniref:hypothetical protein n=1 Tax=Gluconacetobacter entanii TaxID=108528 RepID=UPI001C93676B|nr:hypothetical protein [Gluconacetobacter entanii]MBY4640757.1 hypothetical protein [Gluconacetobacter entanii]MCW4581216.1 hypothetical protein [Gluconacetobacter entanii]MCW4584476.1 hypothetical protein [Gluconacetobacter entanii]MCW4587860.1 hypothetical protein [Gluconacetobacter entanii]